MELIRYAPFALRVVERSGGKAAIIYRRKADKDGKDRLQRLAALSTLALTAAIPLVREAVAKSEIATPNAQRAINPVATPAVKPRRTVTLSAGKFHPLDADWGAKIACFAIIASGLVNADRLIKAAGLLQHADANEAAWWLGMLTRDENLRALRALRILTEAVE
jgi:hypothetical protein